MAKIPNMFAVEAQKRHESQQDINNELENKPKKPTRKEKLNITLPKECKDKLMEYSKIKHISASVLISMWIDEHCI